MTRNTTTIATPGDQNYSDLTTDATSTAQRHVKGSVGGTGKQFKSGFYGVAILGFYIW